MADYSSQQALALRLIREKGMLVTHRHRLFSGTYNAAEDSYSAAEVDTVVHAVRLTVTEAESRRHGFGVGSAMLYIPGGEMDRISTADAFVIGGSVFDVSKVDATAPAEQVVLWAVELKDQGTPLPEPEPEPDPEPEAPEIAPDAGTEAGGNG